MSAQPACVILAGGLARRMGGGDKPLKTIQGKTILDRVIDCVRPQTSAITLNANGDPQRFAQWNLPVVADSIEGFAGPLAGVLAGMDWAAEHAPDAEFILSVAADCPFLPTTSRRNLNQLAKRQALTFASRIRAVRPIP